MDTISNRFDPVIETGDTVTGVRTTPKGSAERLQERLISVTISDEPGRGHATTDTPFAKAVLGKRKGDTVTVKAPGRHYRFKITGHTKPARAPTDPAPTPT